MKDKENQIDEMVSVMAASNNPFVDVLIEIMPNVAEALYNAGYRKLPKDSVVPSREEYNTLKAENDKYVKDCIDYIATINKLENKVWEVEQQASKETAEKIYTKIKDSFLMNSNNRYALKLWIEEQFGVEIKE